MDTGSKAVLPEIVPVESHAAMFGPKVIDMVLPPPLKYVGRKLIIKAKRIVLFVGNLISKLAAAGSEGKICLLTPATTDPKERLLFIGLIETPPCCALAGAT